ncbi:hypothetical protein [Massilia mucilaginosa]|uniref:hypothetical protein n=1 Tax=Massilia mucilaginosa TaxID=2609282 RepID=UPI00351D219B
MDADGDIAWQANAHARRQQAQPDQQQGQGTRFRHRRALAAQRHVGDAGQVALAHAAQRETREILAAGGLEAEEVKARQSIAHAEAVEKVAAQVGRHDDVDAAAGDRRVEAEQGVRHGAVDAAFDRRPVLVRHHRPRLPDGKPGACAHDQVFSRVVLHPAAREAAAGKMIASPEVVEIAGLENPARLRECAALLKTQHARGGAGGAGGQQGDGQGRLFEALEHGRFSGEVKNQATLIVSGPPSAP